jgi:hypothetical protein
VELLFVEKLAQLVIAVDVGVLHQAGVSLERPNLR